MNISPYFQTKTLPSLGLLGFRVVMGAAFIFHGLPKAQNAFGWMGDALPGILQAVAAYSELLGGIALILGLLTPLASLLLFGTMIGALGLVHIPGGDPFVATGAQTGSSELASVYLAGSLLFLLNSPGKFSVDYWLLRTFSRQSQTAKQAA
ncbi:DoxX family protein [Vampirovibrio sp.]|uniref:DoxX family protein n=1 Tax=Vampirovibrio sp. TaxID=2717857 RepID=UPI0035932AED